MNYPREIVYMDKIAVGPEAIRPIDITASPSQNLRCDSPRRSAAPLPT